MAFTFEAANVDNLLEAADVEISVDEAAIFSESNWLGQPLAGSAPITVTNLGSVNVDVYLTADWRGAVGTNIRMATILANRLHALVEVGAEQPYDDTFENLVDVMIIEDLPLDKDNSQDVAITLSLEAGAELTNILQDVGVEFDLMFVAFAEAV